MSGRLGCDCGFDHDQDEYIYDYYTEEDYTDSEYSDDFDAEDDSFDYSGPPIPMCAQCQKTAERTKDLVLRKCTRCESAHYCTRKCQKTHWIHHKEFCDSVWKVTELLSTAQYPPMLYADLVRNLRRFKVECRSWPVTKTASGDILSPKPPSSSKTLFFRSIDDKAADTSTNTAKATVTKSATPVAKAIATTNPTPAKPASTTASKNTTLKPAAPVKATTSPTPAKPTSTAASKNTTAKPATPIKATTPTAKSAPPGPTPPSSKENVAFTKPTAQPIKLGSATGTSFSTSSTKSPVFTKEPGQEVISNGLIKHIDKPYHRLHARTWLHNRPEEDVFKLLIDCFRMRQQDNYTFEGLIDEDSVYGGASHSQAGFKRFLVLAESRADILPSWWFMGKAAANCLRMGGGLGSTGTKWSLLSRKVDKAAIIGHYANPEMPMQLRMLGEQIYLRGPGGQSGVPTMNLKMELDGMYDVTLDMTRIVVQTCPDCGQTFCLSHRQPPDHNCPKIEERRRLAEAEVVRRQEIKDTISQKLTGSPSAINSTASRGTIVSPEEKQAQAKAKAEAAKMAIAEAKAKIAARNAAKTATTATSTMSTTTTASAPPKVKKASRVVTVMKIKKTAQGEDKIPLSSRIYVYIRSPVFPHLDDKSVYVDKTWTVGRSMDKIVEWLKIALPTNEPFDAQKRFSIFHAKDVDDTPTLLNMQDRLQQIASVESGDVFFLAPANWTSSAE
ncbi:hypothetical protein EC991_011312 [Linnemannia zychae]|nr:hypothetical protein EC991_011312 [Linnemannia zychae]